MKRNVIATMGLAALTALSTQAGQYLDYQIKYLQEASSDEADEKDRDATRHFANLAASAASESRAMEVGDLPAHWQQSAQSGRTPQYRARLLELEAVIAGMGMAQREAYAEPVARMQVCLFHARHEMSEKTFWDSIDTKNYIECAESAYAALGAPPQTTAAPMDDLPPARPGECYARIYSAAAYKVEEYQVLKKQASTRIETVPAVYETVSMRRLIKEPSTIISEVPAVYETVEEKILAKEASTRIEQVPATYKTMEEKILVKEASTRLVEVPAVYEMVEERVIDTPAHTVWKEGGKIVEKIDGTAGKVICLVEVPATYKTLKKRVLKSPASTNIVEIPAEYKTVSKQVLDTPAGTKVIEVPAEYQTITRRVVKTPATTVVTEVPAEYADETVQKLVTPATTKVVEIPAEYEVATKTVVVKPSTMSWRLVLCDVNLTAERIRGLQDALAAAGYDPGTERGELNDKTMNAIAQYQQANKLGTGGITLETVNLLEASR